MSVCHHTDGYCHSFMSMCGGSMLTLTIFSLFVASSALLLDREVCYGDLGCFNTQTVRTLSRPIVLLPEEPSKIGTQFFLYTRENPTKSEEQELSRKDATSIDSSSFNSTRPTKIIIHGFTHNAHYQWVQDMVEELLKHDDYNVIAVDWRKGAGFPYTQATANIRVVAAELAKLLEYMFQIDTDFKAGSVHMIGHSLGAHAASEVGTKIKGIKRISGLDPAEPYFEGSVEAVRLEQRDADFVDIIHTDGSAFLGSLGMGYRSSIGHVDFYPNGGAEQPGCDESAVSRLLNSATAGLTDGVGALKEKFSCSHDMSIYYYIESINGKCPFTAYPCKSYDDFKMGKCLSCNGDSCSAMGFYADQFKARGDLYLLTSAKGKAPFCSYHYRLTVTSGTMDDKSYGKVSVDLVSSTGKSFGPIAMTDDDVYVESKTQLDRLFISSDDLGDIMDVGTKYVKGSCFTCFVYTDFIRLYKIEVVSGENQKQTTFCGKNKNVATNQYRQFAAESGNTC